MRVVHPDEQPRVYTSVLSHLTVELPDNPMRYTSVPDVVPGHGIWAEAGFNELNVGMSATETLTTNERVRGADPLVDYVPAKGNEELHRRQTGKTFYILDEPTTGLHFEDVRQLLDVLQRLVDAGNTVLVIEHNLDVIKVADRLIDMGPEGGNGGGTVVVSGTPEQVADCPQSYTGKFLAPLLRRDRERQAQLDAQ